mgnify:CR=1 FL=1|tara:strand:+ start:767871 stop:768557 length:687 start_codon:yes stop_codon:yes gene_type:complete
MNSDQKPLEISKPMWTVIAVVLGVGVIGKLSEPDPNALRNQRPPGAYISQDLLVTRNAGTSIPFPQLGIEVTTDGDWSCLTVEGTDAGYQHTFVNQSSGLIARLNRFPFSQWPPELRPVPDKSAELLLDETHVPPGEIDSTDHAEVRPMKSSTRAPDPLSVQSEEYRHVSVQWIQLSGLPTRGSRKWLGRITTDSGDALVTVVQLAGNSDQAVAIESLCNAIRPLPVP